MRRIMIATMTAALVLASGVLVAGAQPAASGVAALILAILATGPGAATGAFQGLAQADQKTAQALYGAQKATRVTHPPLTLNEIALRRQTGHAWGEIFNVMKSQGLVTGKTLAEAMASRQHVLAATTDAR